MRLPEDKCFMSLVHRKGAFFTQSWLSTLGGGSWYSANPRMHARTHARTHARRAYSALRELLEEWPVRSYRQVQCDGQF